jgi:formyl-CoA transferase
MTFRDIELPMGPVPALGEHTQAILGELGLAADAAEHQETTDV